MRLIFSSIRFRSWLRLGIITAACHIVAFAQPQPSRIVSTFPSVTETLFALGAGDRVVGVSDYCVYPPAVLSLPKIGSYMSPDAEKIALLRPDLVIDRKTGTGLPERLSSLGIRHVDVDADSLADIYSMIRNIGSAIGAPDKAEMLNESIRARLDKFRTEAAAGPKRTVLIIIGRTPGLLSGLIAVGDSTYLGELLRIAGGTNVVTGTAIEYPHISLETVVRTNPDVILDASMMDLRGTRASEIEQQLREQWMSHRELKAVQTGKVFGLVSGVLVTPGPRVPDAVELIRSRIHGAPAK